MKKINVIVIEPNKEIYAKEIENTLKAYQDIVGGYIEVAFNNDEVMVICNDSGLINGLPYCVTFSGIDLYGTVFIVNTKDFE